MNKSKIKKLLSILNITSINQLEEHDLDYWHQKRFIEIQRKSIEKESISNQLIELNNAKEYLDQSNLKDLKESIRSDKKNEEETFTSYSEEELKKGEIYNEDDENKKNDNQVNTSSQNIIDNYIEKIILICIGFCTIPVTFFFSELNDSWEGKNLSNFIEQFRDQRIRTKIFNNGDKYYGEFLNDEKHGQGTLTYANGEKYIGEWENDRRTGYGTYFYDNGDKYDGEWKDDKMTGKGTYFYVSGSKYEGEVLNNKWHGHGIYTWANGDIYKGNWKNNRRTGYGTYFFANGDKYNGEFLNGDKHGQGIYTWANGNKYRGEWQYEKRVGEGTFIYANGKTKRQYW